MVRLNLGCWKRDFGPDWVHIDQCDLPHIQYHDVTKLPFEDDSVDLIYASHLIAYFDREEIVPVLEEWKRVLKPGGVLRLATPDFYKVCMMYYDDPDKSGRYPLEFFLGMLYGKMQFESKTIYHKTTYDYTTLGGLLRNLGFKDVKRYNWRETEHAQFDDHSQSHLPHMAKENGTLMSLNVQCKK